MPRWIRFALLASLLALAARPGQAALLSLTVVNGLTTLDGETTVVEGLPQESLSGTTLTQLGGPLLFDPGTGLPLSLMVRLTNLSDRDIAFPDALPGISVLTAVYALPGYTSKQNVAAGGNAGRDGAAGTEGALSRTAIDLTGELEAVGSPASGSHGGGGGAATGVADNWVLATGASGADLAAYLAGKTLRPGESIDIPDFVRIAAFHRADEGARIAVGFDMPTFSFGGITITTGAWTGTFSAPAPPPVEEPPIATPEPGSLALAGIGLALALSRRRRSRVVLLDRRNDATGERG